MGVISLEGWEELCWKMLWCLIQYFNSERIIFHVPSPRAGAWSSVCPAVCPRMLPVLAAPAGGSRLTALVGSWVRAFCCLSTAGRISCDSASPAWVRTVWPGPPSPFGTLLEMTQTPLSHNGPRCVAVCSPSLCLVDTASKGDTLIYFSPPGNVWILKKSSKTLSASSLLTLLDGSHPRTCINAPVPAWVSW